MDIIYKKMNLSKIRVLDHTPVICLVASKTESMIELSKLDKAFLHSLLKSNRLFLSSWRGAGN